MYNPSRHQYHAKSPPGSQQGSNHTYGPSSNGAYGGAFPGIQGEAQFIQNAQYAPQQQSGTNDADNGAFYSRQYQQVSIQQQQQQQQQQQRQYERYPTNIARQHQLGGQHGMTGIGGIGRQQSQSGYDGNFLQGVGVQGEQRVQYSGMGGNGMGSEGFLELQQGAYRGNENYGGGSNECVQSQAGQGTVGHSQQTAGASFQFPFSGMQQFGGGALGAQLLGSTVQSFVPQYAGRMFQQSSDASQFMRVPKYYFMVDNRYVQKKIGLLLVPFMQKHWTRIRTMDSGAGAENGTVYLPPREDINAPDLYIPVMAFVSYVLLVGFIHGTRGTFKAEIMASTSSVGLAMLILEVLLIKLGLYLVNARPTPWLDIVAFRGYKFVGVNLAMAFGLLFKPLYWPFLFYAATAMGVFLLRSHRRIVLPRGDSGAHPEDLRQRNLFLMLIFVLQYFIYGFLGVGPT